jgi:hypothetical protein
MIRNTEALPMKIKKELFLQLREKATATCGNAYLMDNGKILNNKEYKALNFVGKLQMIMYYDYKTNNVIRV